MKRSNFQITYSPLISSELFFSTWPEVGLGVSDVMGRMSFLTPFMLLQLAVKFNICAPESVFIDSEYF
jgi:hypothetical protein